MRTTSIPRNDMILRQHVPGKELPITGIYQNTLQEIINTFILAVTVSEISNAVNSERSVSPEKRGLPLS